MQAHAETARAAADAADARVAVAAWAAASLKHPTPLQQLPRPPTPPPAVPASATHSSLATADALRLQGNAVFKAGRWKEAASLYTRSLEATPTAAAAANASGALLRTGSAPWAALAAADAALRLRPGWAKAHARKAAALTSLGDAAAAFLEWDRAVCADMEERAGEGGGDGGGCTEWVVARQAALEAAAAVRGWAVPWSNGDPCASRVQVAVRVVGAEAAAAQQECKSPSAHTL